MDLVVVLRAQEIRLLLVHLKVMLVDLEIVDLITKVVAVEDLLLQVNLERVVETVEMV
tara:strand:+ start:385 stop:558 length:174 start_codon:yes stop_codon:yes gene_type:complete